MKKERSCGAGPAWEILVSLQQLGKNVPPCKILHYLSLLFCGWPTSANLQPNLSNFSASVHHLEDPRADFKKFNQGIAIENNK